MKKEKKLEPIEIEFQKVYKGWLYFEIKVGIKSFRDRFSNINDPLSELKKWLEAIAVGVEQTSFEYNNERYYIKFDYQRVADMGLFTISDGFNIYDEENPILFKVNIDRLRFIIAFYTELLNFAYSEMYKKYYSELGEIEEDLCKLLNIESTLKSL